MRRRWMQRTTASGLALTALYTGVVLVSLLQQPGRTTYDTRLELTERPGAFLASAFSLWQPSVNFGEVQNQANGYLFPQGPFFWVGGVLHLAPWVTQRLWTALVLVAACEGMRRLARAMQLPAAAAILAGVAFACSPRLLGTAGVLSAEALPGALAPWAVLPLLLASRARLSAGRAIVLGAAAVVAMGGVNAVETGAALMPAAVFGLWARRRGSLSWRVLAGWIGAVVGATLWWTLPLLLLGRYSPPFYKYVESAATTTSLVGWSEAVRGDTHWLSWLLLPDGRPWWPAAHMLATNSALLLLSAALAAAGLLGLARWSSPYRVPMALIAAVGMAIITVAHGGSAGTPIAGSVRDGLDGPLQIFRNVHKFDPSVRLAVALGVAALFSDVAVRIGRRVPGAADGRWVVVPVCIVLVLGAPYLLDESRTPGWRSIPQSWLAAKNWLEKNGDGRGVLVVPASGFALQSWGATLDEPALGVDIPNRVTLTQAPLLPGATLRFLDALNDSIVSARTHALAEQLSNAGIGFVLVRNDLDQVETGTPSPALSTAALSAEGLEQVADFGAEGVAPVTVYRVDRSEPRLAATAVDDVLTVAGEPESVLDVQAAGLAGGSVVLQGEKGWGRSADIVTDGAERRERQFGSLYGARSIVMQAGEAYRIPRAAHDYSGAPDAKPVVATYDGLASLRASSSRGYADTYGEVVLAEGPAAAIDQSPATRWVTSPAAVATRQWIRMTFAAPRRVHEVTVQPVVGDPYLTPVRRLQVVAGTQARTLDTNPDGAAVTARFDGRLVRTVTVRILRVGSAASRVPVAIAGIHVDDLVPRASLRVPEPLRAGTGFVFHADPGTRPCVPASFVPDCRETRRRTPEEPSGMDRTVSVNGWDHVGVSGLVVARTSRRALRLLEPVGKEQRIRPSSVFGLDPQVSSRFAWDGSPETAWVPADNDAGPSLVFRWSSPRRLSGIRVSSPDPQVSPTRAVLTTRDGRQVTVQLGRSTSRFPSLRTKWLKVTFQRPAADARLVVSEIAFAGADITQPFDRDAVTGAICGLGPHVVVDGAVYQSEVRGTLGDLVDGRPLDLAVCDPDKPGDAGPQLTLAPGVHRISTPPTSEFQTILIAGSAGDSARAPASRSVVIGRWDGTRRSAVLGSGPESVISMAANANQGWRATLDGHELRPLTVDGWQQGWTVPAGKGGHLDISFAPQGWYRVTVAAGLVPAAVVVLLALVFVLRGGRHRPGGVRVLPSGPEPGTRRRIRIRSRRPVRLTGVLVLLMLALGGAAALGGVVGWRWRRRTWPVIVGAVVILASGLLDGRTPSVPVDGASDLLAAVGFGILLVSATCSRSDEVL
jgi:arabinofuranan 3-O-arabinosyltransferase